MHMRRSLMKDYHLRKRVVEKDKEGGSVVSYEAAVPIKATIWPASGKVQAEMYGERLAYIKNMEYEGKDPDYKIISIKEYSPMLMELEKI